MYYRRALKLQAFLDMASESGKLLQIPGGALFLVPSKIVTDLCSVFLAEILEGYKAVADPAEEEKKSQRSLSSQLEAVADMKFTYVATCQIYGNQKQSGDRRANRYLELDGEVSHFFRERNKNWNILPITRYDISKMFFVQFYETSSVDVYFSS